MVRMSAEGDYTVVTSGFIGYGERDQSEGLGGRYEVGRFTDVHEAVEAVRGKGVQGDSGYVSAFEARLYDGGEIVEHTFRVYDRRECLVDSIFRTGEKTRAYLVGWVWPDGTAAETASEVGY